jgi:LytS/YehU family sensor histidine kinase
MVTTIITIVIICGLNLMLMDATSQVLLKSAVPAIPWNWIVTLIIELFFYNERQQKIEREKSHYQFIALRNQINPHFLFNCLNVLSSLAYSDAEKANTFAKRLASVYRYILSTNESQIVDIEDEIAYVNKYIYLEQVRFGDYLSVIIEDVRTTKKGHIIPVSVQQLVENAIKHNICSKEFPLKIEVLIDDIDIKVVNNVQLRKTSYGTGVGLDNIRRQYALHNHHITVSVSDTTFTVSLPIIH